MNGFAYCWLRQLKNFDGFPRQQQTVEKGHRIGFVYMSSSVRLPDTEKLSFDANRRELRNFTSRLSTCPFNWPQNRGEFSKKNRSQNPTVKNSECVMQLLRPEEEE